MSRMLKGFLLGLIVGLIVVVAILFLICSLSGWDWNAIASGAVAISVLVAAIGLFLETRARNHTNVVSSADLTLKMSEYFNSDRFLRVRHGAVEHLYKKYNLNWTCGDDISPYTEEDDAALGLTADLREIFNFFDVLGDLIAHQVIREDQAVETFAMTFRMYYEAGELDTFRQNLKNQQRLPDWTYMDELSERVNAHYPDIGPPEPAEIIKWLAREHTRTHRGSH
jgi:hypothetical protein